MPKYNVDFAYFDKPSKTFHDAGEVVEVTKKRADEINKSLSEIGYAHQALSEYTETVEDKTVEDKVDDTDTSKEDAPGDKE